MWNYIILLLSVRGSYVLIQTNPFTSGHYVLVSGIFFLQTITVHSNPIKSFVLNEILRNSYFMRFI